jgi:hypothetical protein
MNIAAGFMPAVLFASGISAFAEPGGPRSLEEARDGQNDLGRPLVMTIFIKPREIGGKSLDRGVMGGL